MPYLGVYIPILTRMSYLGVYWTVRTKLNGADYKKNTLLNGVDRKVKYKHKNSWNVLSKSVVPHSSPISKAISFLLVPGVAYKSSAEFISDVIKRKWLCYNWIMTKKERYIYFNQTKCNRHSSHIWPLVTCL